VGILEWRFVPIASMLFVCVAVDVARGDEGRAKVRVRVRSSSCIDERSLWQALTARTDKIERDDKSLETIDVELSETGPPATRASGTLVVVRGGQASAPRTLEGSSCEEVLQGLSLVAALAFDPGAHLAPAPAPPPEAPAKARETPAPPNARADQPTKRRIGLGGGAGPYAFGGDAVSVGVFGFVELVPDASGFGPAVRLGFLRATSEASAASPGFGTISTELDLLVGRASGSFVRLDLARGLRLRPWLGVDGGALRATPQAPIQGGARTRGWVAPTVSLRIEWEFFRYGFLETEATLAFPVIREELGVTPSVSIYQAPVVVPSALLAFGVRFP